MDARRSQWAGAELADRVDVMEEEVDGGGDDERHEAKKADEHQFAAAAENAGPVEAVGEFAKELAGDQDEGGGDVDHQPGHFLGGDSVGGQGEDCPQGKSQAEYVPTEVEIDHSGDAEEERQQLVDRETDEVVVPGLVASGHVLLGNPVSHALP